MMTRLTLLVLCLAAAAVPATTDPSRDPSSLIVHEWGTFTSVAGVGGEAVEWWALGGDQDLPCFVDRFDVGKNGGRATVRMETPVVYFYGPHTTTVDVEVQFNQGILTEWFPRATATPRAATPSLWTPASKHKLVWSNVRVSPEGPEDYPKESGPSHYYAARETDAAPIQVGGQTEKFLFYRGVARFSVPITARIADGRILVRNTGSQPIGTAILFENQAGRIGFRVHTNLTGNLAWDPPSLTGDMRALTSRLHETLVAQGLYAKEARAMIETWRDSWFEHGTRIFYIVPTRVIEDVLPLKVDPRPSQIARVFVGRVEIITAAAERDVSEAVAKNTPRIAAKYGRFLPSILERLFPAGVAHEQARLRAARALEPVYAAWGARTRSCSTPPATR